MTPFSTSPVEQQFLEAHILSGNAVDPFGLTTPAKTWELARHIDSMFKPKRQEMFYCPDCNCHVSCPDKTHEAFTRCMGIGRHCAEC